MAPSGPSKSQWGASERKAGSFHNYNLEEGTKMWHKMLEPANDAQPQQVAAQPQTRIGGLPPHLWRQRENANMSQASGSPAPSPIIKPPAHKDDSQAQQTMKSQAYPSPQQSHPQHTPPRGTPSNIAPKKNYPPTPAYGKIKRIPLGQASSSMNPFVKQVAGNRFTVAVRECSPSGSQDGGARPSPRYIRCWDEDERAPTENYTPKTQGPIQNKKWRPKHSEDWESQSLPSTVASLTFSDDNGSHFPDRSGDGNDFGSKDVRGNIADELDIVPKGNNNGWVGKKAWKDYHSSPSSNGDSDTDSFTRGWKTTYCGEWITRMSKDPPPIALCISNGYERHWECDIDPKDGFMMSPIEYLPTKLNPKDPGNDQELDKRMRCTSAMQCAIDYPKMKKRLAKREQEERDFNARNPPPHFLRKPRSLSPAPQPLFVGSRNPVAKRFVGNMQNPSQDNVSASQNTVDPVQQADHSDFGGRRVNIPCHLRPAEPADVSQILEIYNWEVVNGCQALDVKPLSIVDMQRLLKECKMANLPFIVAVQGTPMDATVRKEAPVSPSSPYKQARPTGPNQTVPESQPGPDKILGFGFVSCPMPGLAGNIHSNAGRFIGRVHFYVENASRRNGIGRALLHRLTRCCSKYCRSADWYEWYDPSRAAVFDEPDYNPRNYSYLYIETSSSGQTDPDNHWYETFLDGMDYMFAHTLEKARNVRYDQNDEWRDINVWQHECRDRKFIREF
ncbi:hypothetical protein VM1G_00848 [Cytospora mali]|uniref:Uncharacterized protein n=1 Tax=Cytospora mali TaxID=578113 RepID=A0A194VM10_CYTMA|nr:hypothetical protein VM1G_00848 [Valsa mali]